MSLFTSEEIDSKPQRGTKAPLKEEASKPPKSGSLEKGAKSVVRETTAELPPPTLPSLTAEQPAVPAVPSSIPSGPSPTAIRSASPEQLHAIKGAKADPAIRTAWYASMDQALKAKATKVLDQGAKKGEEVPVIFKTTIDKIKMGRLTELTSLEASQAIGLLSEGNKDPLAPVSQRQLPVVTNILGHIIRSQNVEGAINTFDAHVQANLPDVYEKLQAEGAEGLTYGEADSLIKLEKAFNIATKEQRGEAREQMLISPATEPQLNAIKQMLEANPALYEKLSDDFVKRMDSNDLKGADVDELFKFEFERKKELVTTLVPKVKEIGDEDLSVVASLLSSRLEEKAGHTFREGFVNVQKDKLKALQGDPESNEFKSAFYDFAKYNNADALAHALDQYAQV